MNLTPRHLLPILGRVLLRLCPVRILRLPSPHGKNHVGDYHLAIIPVIWPVMWIYILYWLVYVTPLGEDLTTFARWLLFLLGGGLGFLLSMVFPLTLLMCILPFWAVHVVIIRQEGWIRHAYLNFGTFDTGETDYLWLDDQTLILAQSDEYHWALYLHRLSGANGRDRFPFQCIVGRAPRKRELSRKKDGTWLKPLLKQYVRWVDEAADPTDWIIMRRPRDHEGQCRRFFNLYLPTHVIMRSEHQERLIFTHTLQLGSRGRPTTRAMIEKGIEQIELSPRELAALAHHEKPYRA